jgi:ubiquinone/menaquinone biosynthesis C-methylase UbiE
MMSIDVGKGWDQVWEDVFRRQEWGKYPPEHVIRFVARRWYGVADRRAICLLDLGCGPGACSWYMAREGFSVYGIDGSATAIRRAGERLRQEGLSATFQEGDYGRLPWPDGFFDGVIDNVSLYCNSFETCKSIAAEVRRVLKPGGAFLSVNFTDRSWGYGLGRQVGPGEFTDIREGPLKDKGFALFMGRAQVDELYRIFCDVQVDLCSWTAGEMKHLNEFWVVEARKAN